MASDYVDISDGVAARGCKSVAVELTLFLFSICFTRAVSFISLANRSSYCKFYLCQPMIRIMLYINRARTVHLSNERRTSYHKQAIANKAKEGVRRVDGKGSKRQKIGMITGGHKYSLAGCKQ